MASSSNLWLQVVMLQSSTLGSSPGQQYSPYYFRNSSRLKTPCNGFTSFLGFRETATSSCVSCGVSVLPFGYEGMCHRTGGIPYSSLPDEV